MGEIINKIGLFIICCLVLSALGAGGYIVYTTMKTTATTSTSSGSGGTVNDISCPATSVYPKTSANATASGTCVVGTGTQTALCGSTGIWGSDNVSNCDLFDKTKFIMQHGSDSKCIRSSTNQYPWYDDCNSAWQNEWFTFKKKGTGYNLVNYDEKCLDGNGNDVYLSTCSDNEYQKWIPQDNKNLKHVQSGKCLDGSSTGGPTFNLNPCDNSTNLYQQWTPKKV